MLKLGVWYCRQIRHHFHPHQLLQAKNVVALQLAFPWPLLVYGRLQESRWNMEVKVGVFRAESFSFSMQNLHQRHSECSHYQM